MLWVRQLCQCASGIVPFLLAMEKDPWELLDVDDSNLQLYVSPHIGNSSSVNPGPTSVVQAMMINQNFE